MIDGTYTVSQAAELAGASKNTIRLYSKDFKQFLSYGAVHESGEECYITDDDIKVMVTVRTLRTQKALKEAIIQGLLDGERFKPFAPVEKTAEPLSSSEVTDLATTDLLERFVVRYETRIDELEGKLEPVRDARLDVERATSWLPGHLESMYRRHWYQLWKPDKPAE